MTSPIPEVKRALPMTIAHELNLGKQTEIVKLYNKFHPLAKTLHAYLIRDLQETGRVLTRPNVKNIDSNGLSERYKYEILNNAIGNIKGFKTNIENRVKQVAQTTFDKNQYRLINRAVAFGHCFGPIKPITFKYNDIPNVTLQDAIEAVEIARTIARHYQKQWKTHAPNGSFTLGAKVVKIDFEPTTKHNTVIKLSSLTPYKPIILPIHLPEYTLNRAKEFSGAIQLNIVDNAVKLKIIANINSNNYNTTGTVVGIDVGAVSLITTSDGDLLGRNFWKQVQHLDKLMLRAGKGAAASGLAGPWESPRWMELNSRLHDYVNNELRRLLKGYILRERPAVIVAEDLLNTFSPPKRALSKRLRRLFRRVGRGVFVRALSEYSEEFGFEVVLVNSWYTSKGCSICGDYSDRNRRSQDCFVCSECGLKVHADVHGAREVLNRCSVKDLAKENGSKVRTGGRQRALDYLALCKQKYHLAQQQHWKTSANPVLESRGMRSGNTLINEHENKNYTIIV